MPKSPRLHFKVHASPINTTYKCVYVCVLVCVCVLQTSDTTYVKS